jgi:hypothetical protein
MHSIFNRSNPAIEKVFEEAGKPEKVMCVPIDYAKKTHTALVCNGAGMQLRAPFNVHNTLEGLDFLENIITGLCRKHHIRPKHIIYGGEDCSAFCFNFIHALAARQKLVVGFNAHDAALERGKLAASTDKLDLLGIAGLMLKKQGRTEGCDEPLIVQATEVQKEHVGVVDDTGVLVLLNQVRQVVHIT